MDLLTQVENFVAEINSSNSRNYKIEVLKKYNDPEFLEFLKIILTCISVGDSLLKE